jgi:thymidylate synthase
MYKPYEDRVPDSQYEDRLRTILKFGMRAAETPQGVAALTCFGTLSPMVFDVSNGAPVITSRKIGFWRKPIAEITAFINGARTNKELKEFGCDFWEEYETSGKCERKGLARGDLGPGSYGAVFHDFPMPDGGGFNQFAHVIDQLRKYPWARTHLITPWAPFYIGRGGFQKAVVSPCHGWLHFRVIDGELMLRMDQRSADMPIGVPSNMIQYFALLLMVAQVVGIKPYRYIHSFADAHIYENQVKSVEELLNREPRVFPTIKLDPGVKNLFDFRPQHFELSDYNPHPAMKISYVP